MSLGVEMLPPNVVAFAKEKHAGQVDKQGRDYYAFHLVPIAEALAPFGGDAMMAGLLHDVVEDHKVSLAELSAIGVPEHVVEAVDAVSRREGESYVAFIARAKLNPLGRLVKLVDNWHNLSGLDELAKVDLDAAYRLQKRYAAARAELLAGFLDYPQ